MLSTRFIYPLTTNRFPLFTPELNQHFNDFSSTSKPTMDKNLDESALTEKLNVQVNETLQTESSLAELVKKRDENKRKAEQIQRLKIGNEFALTDTIKKLVEATARLDSDIEEVREQIRLSNESDPQQTARDLSATLDELRVQNAALQLERRAKEAVYDHLSKPSKTCSSKRQLKLVTASEIAQEIDLAKVLAELSEQKTKNKHWTGIRSIRTITKNS